jgi:hypothetical protein
MRIFTSENSLAIIAVVLTLLLIAIGVFEYQTKDTGPNASERDTAPKRYTLIQGRHLAQFNGLQDCDASKQHYLDRQQDKPKDNQLVLCVAAGK